MPGHTVSGPAKRRSLQVGIEDWRHEVAVARTRRWLLAGAGVVLAGLAVVYLRDPGIYTHSAPPHHHDLAGYRNGSTENPHDPVANARLHEAWARFRDHPCDSCHQALRRPAAERCEVCHAETVSLDHHPFGDWSRGGCVLCHQEHDEPLMPSVTGPALCPLCHDDQVPGAAAVQDRPVTLALETVERSWRLDFDHSTHRELTCTACHRHVPGTPAAPDFKPLGFVDCQACHEQRADGWSQDRDPPPRARWHGTGETPAESPCLACHVDLEHRTLRTDSVPERRFQVRRRDHQHFAGLVVAGKLCRECHRRGTGLFAGQLVAARSRFPHERHVPALRTASREACTRCHEDVLGEGLERIPSPPPLTDGAVARVCAACHEEDPEAEEPASLVVEVPPEPPVPPRTWIRFAHGLDGHRERECTECHYRDAERPDGTVELPSTHPEAADCSMCHGREHRNIAGNGCHRCHTPGESDDVYPAVIRWSRVSDPGFSHRSPGHLDLPCEDCHDLAGTHAATSLAAVPVPDQASTAACRGCHVGQRFHFR
jgi:hypothetical protein